MEGLTADLDVHAEVRAHVEGRVDVDELEATSLFDLASKRPGLEGRKNELVVAPDEFVGPALDLPPTHVEAELSLVALFFPRLVDVLQRLKGQDCSADFAGFAVPHQFDFALVGKQEEAILFRQRLALLDELDEVALLGVGEVVFSESCGRAMSQLLPSLLPSFKGSTQFSTHLIGYYPFPPPCLGHTCGKNR